MLLHLSKDQLSFEIRSQPLFGALRSAFPRRGACVTSKIMVWTHGNYICLVLFVMTFFHFFLCFSVNKTADILC